MSDEEENSDDQLSDQDVQDVEAFDEQDHVINAEGMEEHNVLVIPEKMLTKALMTSSLSLLTRLGYGFSHAYVKLKIINREITDISILEHYKFLRFITLSNNLITDLSPLSVIEYLMYAKVDNNRVVEGGSVKTLHYLQYFDLSSNNIVSTDNIAHGRLKHLILNNNQISSLQGLYGPPMSQFKLPSLETLELRGNLLTSLAGVSHLHQVRTLYAAANQITELMDLSFMLNLERLHLRDNPIKKLDGFTDDLAHLHYLNLRGTEVERYREVKKLTALPNLKILILSDTPVSEKEEYRLVVLGILPFLERLDKDMTSKEEIEEAMVLLETREEEEMQEEQKPDFEQEEREGTDQNKGKFKIKMSDNLDPEAMDEEGGDQQPGDTEGEKTEPETEEEEEGGELSEEDEN